MMMPDVDVFDAAQESIDWVNEAIGEFKTAAEEFFHDRKNARFVHEHDPSTRKHIIKFKVFKPLPSSLRRKVTEALVTARHSFDQSIYAAISFFGPDESKLVYFPWAQNPTDLRQLLNMRGIPQDLWPTLEELAPYGQRDAYPGGNNLIRTLATIANDKHTVGLIVQGECSSLSPGSLCATACTELRILPPQWDAINDEIVLATVVADHFEVGDDAHVTLHVLLSNAKLSGPVEVVFALKEFTTFAQKVLDDLKAVCSAKAAGS